MRVHNKTRRTHGRAAATAAATAIVATATLVGVPAQGAAEGAGAAVVGDVLTIVGTNAGDHITVDFTQPGSVVVDLGGASRTFAAGTFHSASVDLRNGDDELRTATGGVLVDVPMTVTAGNGDDVVAAGAGADVLDGGSGDDLLLGGPGADQLVGANGADFVNGQVGTDVEVLGNGDDTAAWNPGEGNDAVDGGFGRDTLAFNGNNGDEQMSLSANGRSAVFLRTQGTIRMDLDGVEHLALATFGGADTVTIGDLSGTEVTTADIDLAGTDGAADRRGDTVLVNGTGASDEVDVAADGPAVDVNGLPARTSITGGDTTDVLRVDTLGGDDRVTVSDQARALLDIQVS